MGVNELKGSSFAELDDKLSKLERELVTIRMQNAMTQNKQTHLKRKLRRDIARVKTLYNEMIKQGNANE